MGPYQRTLLSKLLARAIRYSVFFRAPFSAMGPFVGDFLESKKSELAGA